MELLWPLPHRTDLRDQLLAAYGSPDRGYHDVTHLSEVLRRLEELAAVDDTEVVLAAWYHDAVYSRADDDEERSAQLAETQLGEEGSVDAAEVARLVRLTCGHDPMPGDFRGAVLSDADLAILASPPDRYEQYVDGVRAEYAHLPDEVFQSARTGVLRTLLAKEFLFASDHARRHWEDIARANVARELDRLG